MILLCFPFFDYVSHLLCLLEYNHRYCNYEKNMLLSFVICAAWKKRLYSKLFLLHWKKSDAASITDTMEEEIVFWLDAFKNQNN